MGIIIVMLDGIDTPLPETSKLADVPDDINIPSSLKIDCPGTFPLRTISQFSASAVFYVITLDPVPPTRTTEAI
jgi:hypothetical protein